MKPIADGVVSGSHRRRVATKVTIRGASRDDTKAIAEIYNHGIADGNSTFDDYRVSADRYDSFFSAPEKAALLVAEWEKRVIGWASIISISERRAYRFTCLGSLFVHKDFRRLGVGHALKEAQIGEAARIGYHVMIAEVLSTNIAAISLNMRFNYRVVGEIWEAGYRNGNWIGLVIMQRLLHKRSKAKTLPNT